MPRADLFVVCKNPDCGAEVSPYITECPYCGARLRKRAPKLDRGRPRTPRSPRVAAPKLGRLRRDEMPGIRHDAGPYVTGGLVLATCVIWVATRGGYLDASNLVVLGRPDNAWWRVLTSQFTYSFSTGASVTGLGIYQFATLLAIAVFGWLLERRHGGLVVAGLFVLGGAGGAAVAALIDPQAIVVGANGAALALLCAWAVPDLLERRRGLDYDGDLLGTGAIALVLLAMPVARPEANAIAGGFGVLAGYLVGLGLVRVGRTGRFRRGPGAGRRPAVSLGVAPRSYTAAEVDAAVARLQDPDRFAHASDVVTHAAPSLARVLDEALEQGGWFGQAHDDLLRKAAAHGDPDERLAAVGSLVAEQTRIGMLVGVAVGFELAHELAEADRSGDDE